MRAYPGVNLFHDHAIRRWKEPVAKIALSIDVRCPIRDRGGCIYCTAESYTPYYLDSKDPIPLQISKGKGFLSRLKTRLFLAYFQQETATVAKIDDLLPKLTLPLEDPDCMGIVISTRPDFVYEEHLDRLLEAMERYPDKAILFELGLQSTHAKTLRFLNRQHTLADFVNAAALITRRPRFELGVHLITAIPGEDVDDMRHSLETVVALGVGHLKLHHLQVIRGTALFNHYQKKPFWTPSLTEYFDLLCELLPRIPEHVVIHRLWSTSDRDILHQPRWNLKPTQIYPRLFRWLKERGVSQGQAAIASIPSRTIAPAVVDRRQIQSH